MLCDACNVRAEWLGEHRCHSASGQLEFQSRGVVVKAVCDCYLIGKCKPPTEEELATLCEDGKAMNKCAVCGGEIAVSLEDHLNHSRLCMESQSYRDLLKDSLAQFEADSAIIISLRAENEQLNIDIGKWIHEGRTEFERWVAGFKVFGFKVHPGVSVEENLHDFARFVMKKAT